MSLIKLPRKGEKSTMRILCSVCVQLFVIMYLPLPPLSLSSLIGFTVYLSHLHLKKSAPTDIH